MCKIRNSVNRAWYFERFIIDFFLCRNGLTLIGTDSIIKIKPGMQWTLMKPVWRNHLINQLLLAYLIMTNYSVIILKRIYSFTTVKTHQLLFSMLVLKCCRVTATQRISMEWPQSCHWYSQNTGFIVKLLCSSGLLS